MAQDIEKSKDSTKKALNRLKIKKVLKTITFSNNRYDGYAVYKIDTVFYKVYKKLKNKPSYSNNSLKETTTTKKEEKNLSGQIFQKNVLPSDWEKIETSPMEKVGLTKNKLLDIFESGNISAEGVQESINHFAWGYEHNSKKYEYTNPLSVFIGRLRKGSLWTESGYESPKALALKQVLELKKQQHAEEDKLIDELVGTEFGEWEKTLSAVEKEKVLPVSNGMFVDRATKVSQLKAHYRNKILLPRLQKEKII